MSSSSDSEDNRAVQVLDANQISSKVPKTLFQIIYIKNHEVHDASIPLAADNKTMKPNTLIRKRSGSSLCEICNQDAALSKKVFVADCQHKDMLCQSCLQKYAIYMIEQFGKVRCPHSGCETELKIDNAFFNSLPIVVQIKYKRNVRSYSAMNDSNLRLCPREACKGILRGQQALKCDACAGEFCIKCYLAAHVGACTPFQRQFYEKTLKYRHCPKCMLLVDKFQGGNYMLCECKHQFCYVCSLDWQIDHRNNHDEHGNLANSIPEADLINPQQSKEQQQPSRCCQQQPSLFYYLTIVPRVMLFLLLMGLLIAIFGVLAVVSLLGLACMGKKNNRSRPDTALEKQMKRDEDECLQKMWSGYCSLFGIIAKKLLCP